MRGDLGFKLAGDALGSFSRLSGLQALEQEGHAAGNQTPGSLVVKSGELKLDSSVFSGQKDRTWRLDFDFKCRF